MSLLHEITFTVICLVIVTGGLVESKNVLNPIIALQVPVIDKINSYLQPLNPSSSQDAVKKLKDMYDDYFVGAEIKSTRVDEFKHAVEHILRLAKLDEPGDICINENFDNLAKVLKVANLKVDDEKADLYIGNVLLDYSAKLHQSCIGKFTQELAESTPRIPADKLNLVKKFGSDCAASMGKDYKKAMDTLKYSYIQPILTSELVKKHDSAELAAACLSFSGETQQFASLVQMYASKLDHDWSTEPKDLRVNWLLFNLCDFVNFTKEAKRSHSLD